MLDLSPNKTRRKADSTIALINIIFLMLIFFLLAGQIGTPLNSDLELSVTNISDPTDLPDTLTILADGELRYKNTVVSVDEFWRQYIIHNGEGRHNISILADRSFSASELLVISARLKALGAGRISVITQIEVGS